MKSFTQAHSLNQSRVTLPKRSRKPSFAAHTSHTSQASSLYQSRNFDQAGGIQGYLAQESGVKDTLGAAPDKISVTITYNVQKDTGSRKAVGGVGNKMGDFKK